MYTFEVTIRRGAEGHWPVEVRYQAGPNALTLWADGIFNLDTEQLDILFPRYKPYGELLGKNLFHDDLRGTFAQAVTEAKNAAEPLRMLLILEANELRSIHWEQLCAPFEGGRWDHLLLNQQTPLSIYLPSQIERRFPPIGRRDLRALLLISGPEEFQGDYGLSPFDVLATAASIRSALGEIPCDVLASLSEGVVGGPTLDALCEQLTAKHYTLLHIVCHGAFNKQTGETILYLPKDAQRRATSGTDLIDRLARLDQVHGLPHFVFLSTCESADPRAEIGLGGLGQRLVRELGMPAVLAMTGRISIQTAQAFSAAFYTRLSKHGQVDSALAEALTSMQGRFDITVPALFSRLGGRALFSDTLDRPLTEAEIRYGLDQSHKLIEVRAPVLLPELIAQAKMIGAALGSGLRALSHEKRYELEAALVTTNQLCGQALDMSFNALAMGQEPPEFDDRCPFRGLYPFRAEDREFFFGRQALVTKLAHRLKNNNFLAILGPSGCGKSSLVLAGVVPFLGLAWQYLTPGATPLSKLDAVLQTAGPEDVLVVDQFEELFTLCKDENQRQTFIDRLMEIATRRFLVLTMRADFWGECAQYQTLKDKMQSDQELVAPLDAENLRLAMEQQADHVGLRFEAGLGEKIFDDVQGEPGAMPLLQHALLSLWKRRHGRWLRWEEYSAFGGIKQAIAHTADEVYEAFSEPEKALVRNIFLRLTMPGEEVGKNKEYRDTSHRVAMVDLVPARQDPEVVKIMLQRLADVRLVVTSVRDDTKETEVEIAHEALIRHWPRLRAWLDEDRANMILREGLTQAARDWEALERDQGALYRGVRLAQASEWVEKHKDEVTSFELDFINASIEQEKHEEIIREEQRQRELKLAQETAEAERKRAEEQLRARGQLQKLAIGLVIVMLIAMAAAGVAFWLRGVADTNAQNALNAQATAESNRQEAIAQKSTAEAASQLAEENAQEALRQRDNAIEQEKIALVAQSKIVLQQGNQLQLGMLLALEAYARAPSPESEAVLREGLPRLPFPLWRFEHKGYANALAYQPDGSQIASAADDGVMILNVSDGKVVSRPLQGKEVLSVAFSPDGKWLVTGEDRRAHVWDAISGQEVASLAHTDWVTYMAFSPDGKCLATAGWDGIVRIWNSASLSEGEPGEHTHFQHDSRIYQIAFNPAGNWLASASQDGSIWLWDIGTNQEISRLFLNGPVLSVAFSPNGDRLAAGSGDATARVWDLLPDGTISETYRLAHGDWVENVVFSPDSSLLATASDDTNARLWDLANGGEVLRMAHSGWVNLIAFSPDGKWLATGSGSEYGADFTARLWDPASGQEVSQMPHRDALTALSFSPAGDQLVSADASGLAQSWDIAAVSRREISRIVQQDLVRDIAFNASGGWLATASDDDFSAWLWDPGSGTSIAKFSPENRDFVRSVALSPDRRWLAAASDDKTVYLWDLSAGLPAGSVSVPSPQKLHHEAAVYAVAFSPDGNLLASGGADLTTRLWDVNAKDELNKFEHEGAVFAVTFSPDGKQLAAAGEDGSLVVRDVVSGHEILSIETPYVIRDVAYRPDGKSIAAMADRFVYLFEVSGGKEIFRLAHDGEGRGIAFSPDGVYLASTSDDGTTRIWDATTGEELGRILHTGNALTVAFSPDGAWLAASSGNTARIWAIKHLTLVHRSDLTSQVCKQLTRNLTADEWQLYFGEAVYHKTCSDLP